MIFRNIFSKLKQYDIQTDRLAVQRFERKFFINPFKKGFARTILTHLCLPDSEYPKNIINSLYFDTADLDEYHKSNDGDYRREKVRIRWYDDPNTQTGIVPVWLELKYKSGFAGKKKRKKFLVPVERLRNMRSNNTILDRTVIMHTLSEFGYFPEPPLQPTIVINYQRLRFVEIMSGFRLSFDWDIGSYWVSPFIGFSQRNLKLQGAIIEIKGPTMHLPQSLRSLKYLGTDWSRFSKYAGCIDAQMEIPDTTGQLWPSGRIGAL
jgi:hypothetical protein